MAKRCEVCGKGPVVGRTVSHAHNVGPRRFEPNLQTVRALVKGATKRMQGLHAVPPRWQDHQSGVSPPSLSLPRRSGNAKAGALRDRRARRAARRSGPTRPPSAPATSCSSPVRFPSIRRPARSSRATSRAQTEQVMRNIGALLDAAGAGFEHVVRTTVFLADMNEFAAMNECYAEVRDGSAAGALDRAGGAAAARRAGRDRRDRRVPET